MTVKSLLLEEAHRLQIEALKSDKRQIEISIVALDTFHTMVVERFGSILAELVDGNIEPTNPQRTDFRLPISYRGIKGSITYNGYDMGIQFPDPSGGMSGTWSRVAANALGNETKIAVWLDAIASRIEYARRVQSAKEVLD